MKAILMQEPGVVQLIEQPMPEMADDALLLRVEYVGLCGSDLSAYSGHSPMMVFPNVPGHEIAARIEAVGDAVPDGFAVGDLVLVKPYFPCGKCPACRNNRPNACEFNQTMGTQRPGALCEYITVPYAHALVCNDIEPQTAALVEPLSVGMHLINRVEAREGDVVAVFGCGVIGLGAIAAAVYKKARVFAVDVSAEKLAQARRMGAEQLVNATDADAVAALKALTQGDGVDIALECSGANGTFNQAIESVKFTGKMGVVSYTKQDVTFNTKLLVAKELNIYGSRNAVTEFETVLDMVRSGIVPVDELITFVCAPDDVEGAFKKWKADPASITKILTKW